MDYIALFEKYLGPGKRAGSQITFYCPWCDTGSRRGDRHLYMNPLNGVYCCYKCMHDPCGKGKGSAYHFAKLMGETDSLTVPTNIKQFKEETAFNQRMATAVYSYLFASLTLLPEHKRELCKNRGLLHPENFGVCSCVGAVPLLKNRFPEIMLLASGLFYKRNDKLIPHSSLADGRILIPYYSNNIMEVTFMRSRRMAEDGSVKYLSPIGSMAGSRVWGKITPKATAVVIPEGEIKAMSAVEAQILAISPPGMGVGHQEIVKRLRGTNIKRAYICFDTESNPETQKKVDNCATALGRRIIRELGIEVFNAHMPLEAGISDGKKMDVDSFLFKHTRSEYLDILRAAEPL